MSVVSSTFDGFGDLDGTRRHTLAPWSADPGASVDVGPGLAALKEKTMLYRSIAPLTVVLSFALLTAACGNRPVDRALTGGAIGAGTGAVVGSTVGNPIAGAVVGGAAGATIGAVTAPER
jgi:osmotically inducible lipoprotein OsmB